MSERLDRVLALLDGTGQHSHEGGHGHDADGWCARCQASEPAEGGDLCAGCRAFLLGDTDLDPSQPWAARLAYLSYAHERGLADGTVVHHINGDHRDNRPENLALVRPHWQPAEAGQHEAAQHEAAMDRLRDVWSEPNDTQLDRLHSLVVELGARMAVPLTAAADGLTSVINAYRERRTR